MSRSQYDAVSDMSFDSEVVIKLASRLVQDTLGTPRPLQPHTVMTTEPTPDYELASQRESLDAILPSTSPSQYLCLTILGYRKPGMSEEAYRHHMNNVSAPMTKELMTKYGVKRWTVVSVPSDLGPHANFTHI